VKINENTGTAVPLQDMSAASSFQRMESSKENQKKIANIQGTNKQGTPAQNRKKVATTKKNSDQATAQAIGAAAVIEESSLKTVKVTNTALPLEGNTDPKMLTCETTMVAENTGKKNNKRVTQTQPLSEMAVRGGVGQIAGWKEKTNAVEGYGCEHLALMNFQAISTLQDLKYRRSEGQYMDNTSCHGTCQKSANDMDWKTDKNQFGDIVHFCNVCMALRTDKYCMWYCDKCFTVAKEAETAARGENTNQRRTRRRV
jgi:hypothetical protein